MKPTTNTDTQLISQLAYAKHRGVSHGAVAKAIKSGRLSLALHRTGDGKIVIDAAAADKEWDANTNEAKRTVSGSRKTASDSVAPGTPAASAPARKRAARTVAKSETTPVAAPVEGMPLEDVIAKVGDAKASRAIKEHYLAQTARLDYEERSKALINAAEAERALFRMARTARDMLLTMADRLAPEVADLTDQFKCHAAIMAEVRRVCEELSANPLGGPADQESGDAKRGS